MESRNFYLSSDKKKYIRYDVVKNSVPVTTLFIHGNLSSNKWWYPLIDSIRKTEGVVRSGDIILAEIRGCGLSSDVDEAEVISILDLSNEFLDLVNDLKLKQLNLVGHSTGGSIVFSMLTKLANLNGRAVLIDPVGARGRKFETPIMKAFEKMKSDRDLVRDVMKATIRCPLIDPVFFEDTVVSDAFRAAQVMGLKIAQAFSEFNCVEKLGRIQSSVLVLHGDQDQVLPISDSMELAQMIPQARFEALKNMGHCPNLEDPERLWKKMRPFLFG